MRAGITPRPHLLLIAAAVLALLLARPGVSAGQAPNSHTFEPLGYIAKKGNPIVLRGQIELSVTYLRSALTVLETSTAPDDLLEASDIAYQGYRMMRFAIEGLGYHTEKRNPNPIYEMVSKTMNEARFSVIHARLALGAAAKWTENNQAQVDDAITKLKYALSLAEQAQLLI